MASSDGGDFVMQIIFPAKNFPKLTHDALDKHVREAFRRAEEYLWDRLSWYE